MPSVPEMRATVDKYLALVATGTAEEITALYADGATLEDPVGAEPLVGKEAILAFYKVIEPIKRSTELISFKAGGDTAVFQFKIVTAFDALTVEISPVDIMIFDEAGAVTSMRAVWSQDEMIMS
ncbi:nuclear transport factor 2 family protein [Jatrophihabitans sp.]|uniref:nuclear transport factor 2 family protein n=1 Tax=Jatrophihabitans sp. TaxID=1932789 RepID=UPI0030C716ED|nr:ksi [Jatrophihabitans sp.]